MKICLVSKSASYGELHIIQSLQTQFPDLIFYEVHVHILHSIFVDPLKIFAKYKSNKIDVVFHLGSTGPKGLVAALASKLLGCRSIVRSTGQTFQVWRHQNTIKDKIKIYIKNNLMGGISYYLADRIWLLDESFIPLNPHVYENKYRCCRQPVRTDWHQALLNAEVALDKRKRREGINNELRCLSIMRIEQDKGIDNLLKFVESNKNLDFTVVGGGDKKAISKLKSKGVTVFGYCVGKELLEHYFNADLIFIPSNCEGIPNVYLEAKLLGLPVLTIDNTPYWQSCDTKEITIIPANYNVPRVNKGRISISKSLDREISLREEFLSKCEKILNDW